MPVVCAVDHGCGDVLVHEEENGQTEAESHRADDLRQLKVAQRRRLEDVALDQLELFHWRNASANIPAVLETIRGDWEKVMKKPNFWSIHFLQVERHEKNEYAKNCATPLLSQVHHVFVLKQQVIDFWLGGVPIVFRRRY